MAVRVIIVEDESMLRWYLRKHVSTFAGVEVVAEAEDG
jgi:YesN/AraC family two-component response regulator